MQPQIVTYLSSISTDPATGAPLTLTMELNYDPARNHAPIAVVMHQFTQATGNFAGYRPHAQRLRDSEFFALTVAMRGRDGSGGARDSGGLEIYDIYDAVEHVKAHFPNLTDASNISITGYSGGGGNVLSAVTKFPDYFRAASCYFGMSDYGLDPEHGWYQRGASSGHRAILERDIGNPTLGDPRVRDRYLARASCLASRNNPCTEIHLFVNEDETTCPPVHLRRFRDNARAQATFPGEYSNIHLHLGKAGQEQSWPHQAPTAGQQAAAEQWYVPRLLRGDIATPVLKETGRLFVGGFVRTQRFELWIGDGQNGAGFLDYRLNPREAQFTLDLQSSDLTMAAWVVVQTEQWKGLPLEVYLNDALRETIPAAPGHYRFQGLGHGCTVRLRACG